jgi:hypothetical protein
MTQRRFGSPPLLGEILAKLFAYLLVCVVLWRLARVPRKLVLVTAALVLPIALLCSSCGGSGGSASSSTNPGSGSGSPPPPVPQGTPAGAFTITVTATSGSLSHTTNVTLKVN